MLKSTKRRGEFETVLIDHLRKYFQRQGYSVRTHSRLNVAWSRIISDIDIIAVSREEVIIIEVKSERDNFSRGFEQLRRVKGFATRLYIATDKELGNLSLSEWPDDAIGLLHIIGERVNVTRSAKKLLNLPDTAVFSQLKKKCLIKLVRLLGIPTYLPKKKIEQMLRNKFGEDDLRMLAGRIAFCDKNCEVDCVLEPFFVAVCSSAKTAPSAAVPFV